MTPKLRKQVTGTISNIGSLFSGATLKGLLPPSIYGTLIWVRDTVPRALGFTGSRIQQITGVVAVSLVMIIASFTLLTWLAVVFFAVFMPIALLRLIPAVHVRWPLAAGDWPLWSVGG